MWAIIALIGYLSIQLVIGYIISKRVKTDSDYFLAGRSLGLPFVAISVFATWFGAETVIGSSAAVFSQGLSGTKADPFGYALCLLLASFLLAKQLWKMKITTLGDFYLKRFSHTVERIAVFVIIPSSLIWAAAQLQAFGQILSVMTGVDHNLALFIAAAVAITYTTLGGLMADVANDMIQGTVLIVGLLLVLFFSIDQLGGVSQTISIVMSVPSKLSFRAPDESFWAQMDTWMIPILGSLVAQEMISRMLASRNADIAKTGTLTACGIYLFVGLIPVLLGLVGSHIVTTGLPNTEQFLPTLAKTMLPGWMFVIFCGAIIAAIMSTIDSTMLSVSAFVTHNLLSHRFYSSKPKRQVFIARCTVVGAGLVAVIIATSGESVYSLVETASSFGAAGVLVVTLGGLWFKNFGGPISAAVALISGVVMKPIVEYYFAVDAPFITAIVITFFVYVSVATLEGTSLLFSVRRVRGDHSLTD